MSKRTQRATPRPPTAVLGLLALAAVVLSGCQVPLGPVQKLGAITNVWLPETSDPSIINVAGEYFVYGSDNHLRAPVTRLGSLDGPLSLARKNASTFEAMPAKPPWAARQRQLWAPTVGSFAGRWVMFFSADRPNPPQPWNAQCVGRAWADHPAGPFVAEAAPVTCGIGGVGGALDPQLFTDAEGRPWLLVAFGDTETPLHTIPLDGSAALAGPAQPLLRRQHGWEYHFIENPSMLWDPSQRNYLLAYSAGRWWEPGYSTGIARCATPTGPCTSDPSGPWVASSNGRTAPGGLSFFTDREGHRRAVFSTFAAGAETTSGGRAASVMFVSTDPPALRTTVK